jgi:hypothetical protein
VATRTVTIRPSGGDYTTLNAAIAAEGHDLTVDNGSGGPGILVFERGGDWSGSPEARTAFIDIDGYTTSETYYIKITSDSANRPTSKWDTTKYILEVTDANAFAVRENYIWIDRIQVQIKSQTAARAFFQNIVRSTGWIRLSNCIFRGDGGAQKLIFYTITTGNFEGVTMWNCLCYGWGSHSDSYFGLTTPETMNIYNSKFIWPSTSTCGVRREDGTLTMVNCYSGGNTAGRDYFGTIGLTTCASSDTTGNIDNIAVNTTNFINVTGGSEDYRLPAGSGLIGVGTDDPGIGLYSDDMNGDARTSPWDVGDDEYVAAGGETYYQSLDGSLSFSGAAAKQTNKQTAGVLSFSGAAAKQISKGLLGSLSFSGGAGKLTSKPLAGAFSFTGAATKITGKALAGSLSFSGGIAKITAKALAGAVSFSGAVARLTQKAFAGVLSFSGALSSATLHMYYQAVGGVIAFTGEVQKVTAKGLQGAITFAGSVAKLTQRALAGALAFVGDVQKLAQKLLEGVLGFLGSLSTSTGGAPVVTVPEIVELRGAFGGSVSMAGSISPASVSCLGSFGGTVSLHGELD